MKILNVTHNSITYEFRLLEQSRVIEISKDGVFSYTIMTRRGLATCDCPGGKFRHSCWHPSMIATLKKQPSLTAPWIEWAEEAGRMMYLR
jgi:hypothetical protein